MSLALLQACAALPRALVTRPLTPASLVAPLSALPGGKHTQVSISFVRRAPWLARPRASLRGWSSRTGSHGHLPTPSPCSPETTPAEVRRDSVVLVRWSLRSRACWAPAADPVPFLPAVPLRPASQQAHVPGVCPQSLWVRSCAQPQCSHGPSPAVSSSAPHTTPPPSVALPSGCSRVVLLWLLLCPSWWPRGPCLRNVPGFSAVVRVCVFMSSLNGNFLWGQYWRSGHRRR